MAPKCLKLEAGKPLPIVRLQHAIIVNYLIAKLSAILRFIITIVQCTLRYGALI